MLAIFQIFFMLFLGFPSSFFNFSWLAIANNESNLDRQYHDEIAYINETMIFFNDLDYQKIINENLQGEWAKLTPKNIIWELKSLPEVQDYVNWKGFFPFDDFTDLWYADLFKVLEADDNLAYIGFYSNLSIKVPVGTETLLEMEANYLPGNLQWKILYTDQENDYWHLGMHKLIQIK